MRRSVLFALALVLAPALASPSRADETQLELVSVDRIWDQGNHNAFTDLVRFGGRFFCVFREGTGHVSPDGAVRVLESKDGRAWTSAALLTQQGHDLRDPKITTTPGGKLMIVGGAAVREGTKPATSHQSFVTFSADGRGWDKLHEAADKDFWLWRVTWHKGKAYGVGYDCAPDTRAEKGYSSRLYVSDDGKKFTPLVESLYSDSGPTEATLRFASDDTCYCLHRRDGRPTNTALLGTSKPPYKEWTWKDLGTYYGGPNFLELPGGRFVAAGRIITKEKGAQTVLCDLDVKEGKLTPLLTLPSGGDTSYPGLVGHEGLLYVSYYASHEGKTSVYLAQVKVK
jgi:hypothetical protein